MAKILSEGSLNLAGTQREGSRSWRPGKQAQKESQALGASPRQDSCVWSDKGSGFRGGAEALCGEQHHSPGGLSLSGPPTPRVRESELDLSLWCTERKR